MATASTVRALLWFEAGINIEPRQRLAITQDQAPLAVQRASEAWGEAYFRSATGVAAQAYCYAQDVDFYMPASLIIEKASFATAISVILVLEEASGVIIAGFCDHLEVAAGWTHEDKFGVDASALINELLAADQVKRLRALETQKPATTSLSGSSPRSNLTEAELTRRMRALRQAQ